MNVITLRSGKILEELEIFERQKKSAVDRVPIKEDDEVGKP